jgi:23S rRNA (adenine2030-N6)-methyltransferase
MKDHRATEIAARRFRQGRGMLMNYRHAFHAGNFADLLKHVALLAIVEKLKTGKGPIQVIDTHAGAGAYDLRSDAARKSGEADAGIVRLVAAADAPDVFASLRAAVAKLNPGGGVRLYPGSPALMIRALSPQDAYVGCELRPDEHQLLAQTLAGHRNAQALLTNGFAAASAKLDPNARNLVLIDPPFEAADDYAQIAATVKAVLARRPSACLAIWVPLKDLETFDALLRRLEEGGAPALLIAETRLRPLMDPMKMNGSAMVMINAPSGLQGPLEQAAAWIAATLGGPGAASRVWTLGA